MDSLDDLNAIEKVVLAVVCKVNNLSLKAHTPPEKIVKKIRIQGKKYVKKALKSLRSKGYIRYHFISGGNTIQLTKKGQIACKKLLGV